MAMRSAKPSFAWAAACCVAAGALIAGTASAQSLNSLSDRVAALEARSQQTQSQTQESVALLNRIAQLESDIKDLRGLVEQMQHDDEQAAQRAKDQYQDLDRRLSQLEHAGTSASLAAAPVKPASAPAQATVARTPDVATATTPSVAAPGTQSASATANPVDDQTAYKAALATLTAEQYADAAQRFAAFVQQYPDSPLMPNAYYWMGESYYVTQNYALALQAFQTVVTRYPDSNKMPDALLKVGFSQDGLKQRDAAEATLRAVIARYPDSEAASRAQSRLRVMSMDTGR